MKEKAKPEEFMERVKWKRVGRCDPRKCGAFCCRMGPLMREYRKNEAYAKFLMMFGWSVVHEFKERGKTYQVFSTCKSCPHLKGIRCNIHKKRPRICRNFPESRDMRWYEVAKAHGCTYRFVRVRDTQNPRKQHENPQK